MSDNYDPRMRFRVHLGEGHYNNTGLLHADEQHPGIGVLVGPTKLTT